MNLNKLTVKTQEALQNAQEIASSYGNQVIEPEHLLAALIQDPQGTVVPVLEKTGVNLSTLKIRINDALGRLPKVSGAAVTGQSLSPALGRLLDAAQKQATELHDEYLSTEHVLLALAASGEGPAGKLLRDQGLTAAAVLNVLKEIRGTQRVTDQNPGGT